MGTEVSKNSAILDSFLSSMGLGSVLFYCFLGVASCVNTNFFFFLIMVGASFIQNKGHHSQSSGLTQNTQHGDVPQESEDQDTAHTSDGAA